MMSMKNFAKTLTGKIIIFAMCVIFICTSVASLAGIIFMINNGYYSFSKESVNTSLKDEFVESYANGIVYSKHMPGSYEAKTFIPDNNIHFVLLSGPGDIIASSPEVDEKSNSYRKWKYKFHYSLHINGNYVIDIERVNEMNYDWETLNTLYIDITDFLSSNNTLTQSLKVIDFIYAIRHILFAILVLSVILFIASFVILLKIAGKRPDNDKIIPGVLNSIPYDVLLLTSGILYISLFCNIYALRYNLGETFAIVLLIIVALFTVITCIGLCMSLTTRIKTKTFVKKLLIYRIYLFLTKSFKKIRSICLNLIEQIPFIWRTILIVAGISICEFIAIVTCNYELDNLLIWWFLEKIVLIPLILIVARILRKLQAGATALANGDLKHHTDTSKMFWDFRQHGENLNNIAKGMTIAVEDRIKSERMKTELITNVSHDIKTPLTSIINYTNLIANEDCDNENINQYAEVLTRQADRLKRLIDDLVEASKASTGNLDVNLAPCDAAIFISQADGEYDEKLKKSNLTLITKQPDTPVFIMADGRRMWRIFDNLMNNICKYAQSGTRVYLSLETQDNNAVITFKNISKDEMDISEDELMERFVLGDSSRNTEGNGLGLSIAKSMAELQNGSLSITIDGDLFKAILTFPIAD